MAFWYEGRNRLDLDNVVRQSDHSLNVLVVLFLAAFVLMFGAYRYGQLSQMPGHANATISQSAETPQKTP